MNYPFMFLTDIILFYLQKISVSHIALYSCLKIYKFEYMCDTTNDEPNPEYV